MKWGIKGSRRARSLVALVLVGGLGSALAACGDDDDSSADTVAATDAAPATNAPDGTEAPAGTEAPSSSGVPVDWTYDVDFLAPDGSTVDSTTWEALPPDEVTKEWNICAAIVHLKDPYWLALNYGLAEEAARTNTKMTLLAAGGYTELSTQINQMDDCVAQGADGIILGATSAEGVVAKAEEIIGQGIPVVGIGVPVFSDQVPVAFASFYAQGRRVGEYLLDEVGDSGEEVKVAFLPGPEGAGWPEDSLRGFEDAIEGSNITVEVAKFGDTGREVQLSLVEDVLQAYPDIDYIVGNAVAATVAPQAIEEAGRDIGVISTYITADTYLLVKDGSNLATVSDSTALTGRLGYDMLLRILEGEDLLGTMPSKDVGPAPFLVTKENLAEFEANRDYHIPPDGFEPVFSVG